MPGFNDSELEKIVERARIVYPSMDLATAKKLNELYDHAVLDLNMGAFAIGASFSTWGDTFTYMVETSGLERLGVSSFLVGMREYMDGTIPSDSWLDRLGQGAEAILTAPADAVNIALGPIFAQTAAAKKALTIGAYVVGGIVLIYGFKFGNEFLKKKKTTSKAG